MTTSAGAMDSIGIPPTGTHAYWTLLPSPPLWTLGILTATGRVEHLTSGWTRIDPSKGVQASIDGNAQPLGDCDSCGSGQKTTRNHNRFA